MFDDLYPNKQGAINLLTNCLDIQSGNNVLLVCEDPQLGWYDEAAANIVADSARELGANVSFIEVGGPDDEPPSEYTDQLGRNDTIIFLARLGDQDRFSDNLPGKNVAMLYTRDAATLSSSYATTDHRAMKDLKFAIDTIMHNAQQIKITCPLGTELICDVGRNKQDGNGDVTINRFPMCVPQPIPANTANGYVALSKCLAPTGAHSYVPASCTFESVIFAEVKSGRTTGFHGDAESVRLIEKHYENVSQKFGIEKNLIHSWHAGIHPGCFYNGQFTDDPDRWANNVFGNPRFLHFHTCGDYPPGEICWMVLDPIISFDGVRLWDQGRLLIDNFEETSRVAKRWREIADFEKYPNMPIGI